MKDLKLLFENLGCTDVVTYIQSGNVIFKSKVACNIKQMASQIEDAIFETYDFKVLVLVVSAINFRQIVERSPFIKEERSIDQLHLTFLSETPNEAYISSVKDFDSGLDQFHILDNAVYICCQGKYHKSKLSNNFFEAKLQVSATTRNWKTVLRLIDLSC